MTPAFKIIAAGINITDQIKDRLLRLTVVDEAGFKSDAVEIELDDRDNEIELPLPGAPLVVFMGYEETYLMPMGIYTADEVMIKGPPETLTIRGKSVDLGGSIKEQKTRAWDNVTLKDIITKIAGEHNLIGKVAKRYQDFQYEHLDQTNESDIHFVTRLAKEHDAIATVKGDALAGAGGSVLLFTGRGEGKNTDGIALPPRPVHKIGKLSWAATLATRGNFQSVEANWHNAQSGARDKVTAGEGGPVKKLRQTHPNKEEAEQAAKSKLDEFKRGNDTLRITMPGDPTHAAEGQILAIGFRAGVSGLWSVTRARHEIGSGGFKTTIETEKPKDEADQTTS